MQTGHVNNSSINSCTSSQSIPGKCTDDDSVGQASSELGAGQLSASNTGTLTPLQNVFIRGEGSPWSPSPKSPVLEELHVSSLLLVSSPLLKIGISVLSTAKIYGG